MLSTRREDADDARVGWRCDTDKDTRSTIAGVATLVVTVAGTATVATLGNFRTTDVMFLGFAVVGAVGGLIAVATRSYPASLLAGALGQAATVVLLNVLKGTAVPPGGALLFLAVLGLLWGILEACWLGGFTAATLFGYVLVDAAEDMPQASARQPGAGVVASRRRSSRRIDDAPVRRPCEPQRRGSAARRR